MTKPYIVIAGPTASGKSELAVSVAKSLSGEVVNADAMQVYKELFIGAAKLTKEEMQGVAHHLIDVVSIGESFSVAEYKTLAVDSMEEIRQRGNVPIVCGGTGLYVNALTGKLDFTAVQGDPALRAELSLLAESKGKQALYQMLREVDPASAARLHPNDQKRIIRALEVTQLTGKPYSEYTGSFAQNAYAEVPACMVGLKWDRQTLNDRIDARVDRMMEQGLLEEARTLFAMGIPLDHPSMMGLGYRQLFDYLSSDCTLSEAVDRIKLETRRFAKRQMTWFMRDLRIHWFEMNPKVEINALTDAVCGLYEAAGEETK